MRDTRQGVGRRAAPKLRCLATDRPTDSRARRRMTTAGSADARRDELVERLFGSALGAMDLLCVYLGDRLGLYKALADTGPSTSAELAHEAGVNERYAREWLEQQAMTGILEAVDPDATDAERRYALPTGHDEVLLDGDSL